VARRQDDLSLDEVGALFQGRELTPAAPESATTKGRAYRPVYDPCDRCQIVQPSLLQFLSDADWSPELALDDPVHVELALIRRRLGKRRLLICCHCVEAMQRSNRATPPDIEAPRLFAVGG